MKNFLILIGGIAIGVGVSWTYHKGKYETMVQEEVESLREHMKEKESEPKQKYDTMSADDVKEYGDDIRIDEEEIEKVEKIINYSKYSNKNPNIEVSEQYKKPFVVTPDDFASIPGFDTDSFYYHHDDIISNDNQEIVDDVEIILGLTAEEIREQFGVYEEDAVYIRNMRLKCDYEILREETDYLRRNGD